jgi:hypothetical protein
LDGWLNEVEGKEKYRVEVSNRLAGLEGFDAAVEMYSSWETVRKDIVNISAERSKRFYELKKRSPWFDEGSSELLDQRK